MKGSDRIGEGRGRGEEKRGAVKEKATKGMKRRIHKRNVKNKTEKHGNDVPRMYVIMCNVLISSDALRSLVNYLDELQPFVIDNVGITQRLD